MAFILDKNHLDSDQQELSEEILDFSYKNIKSINQNIFEGRGQYLRELKLSNNEIDNIALDLFTGLFNLKKLWLNHNKLSSIDWRVFNHLENLILLDLRENKIKHIDSNLFKNKNNLKHLYLGSNRISTTTIKEDSFDNLRFLEYLDLNNNELSKISSGLFKNLDCLKILFLSNNKITDFEDPLKIIGYIDLSFNNLSKINLKNINGIDLSFNELSEVNLSNKDLYPYPWNIDLSSNNIIDFSKINIKIKKQKRFLGEQKINIDLRFNKISTLSADNIQMVNDSSSVDCVDIQYDVRDNPLNKETKDILEKYNNFKYKKETYQNIEKISFQNTENPILKNVKDWININEFSVITGVNGIGKSSILDYIQSTSTQYWELLNHYDNKKIKTNATERTKEIETFNSFVQFFKSMEIEEFKKSGFPEVEVNKVYIPVLYRMYDKISPINVKINIVELFRRDINSFDIKRKLDRNRKLIEIFSINFDEKSNACEALIEKNFRNKLDVLNEHLKSRNFKYKIIDKNEAGIRFMSGEEGNEIEIESKHLSPGEQLMILFYTWEFVLNRINFPHRPLILLDEPDAHLHPKAVHEFVEILKRLSQAGAQIIMTTHNPTTVSFVDKENLYCMKEKTKFGGGKVIEIEKAKSKANIITELTSNLVMVNLPYRIVFCEGTVKETDLSNFHDEGDDSHNQDANFFKQILDLLRDYDYTFNYFLLFKNIQGCNKVQSIMEIFNEGKIYLDHYGIIDNDNYFESLVSNKKESLKVYYEKRDKNVLNLLRNSIENYILDPINVFFYLKFLNNKKSKKLKINNKFDILINRISEELKAKNIQVNLNEINHINKLLFSPYCDQIMEIIVNNLSKILIDYLTESECFNFRLFHTQYKNIRNLTPLLRFTNILNQDKKFFYFNSIDLYLTLLNECNKQNNQPVQSNNINYQNQFNWPSDFIGEWTKKCKILNQDGKNDEKNVKEAELMEVKKVFDEKLKSINGLDIEDKDFCFNLYIEFQNYFKTILRKGDNDIKKIVKESQDMPEVLKKLKQNLNNLPNISERLKKFLENDNIEVVIKKGDINKVAAKETSNDDEDEEDDTSDDTDDDDKVEKVTENIGSKTIITKDKFETFLKLKSKLDNAFIDIIKDDLKSLKYECYFIQEENKESLKVKYPVLFYNLKGHFLEELVYKVFFEGDFKQFKLIRAILQEEGAMSKCGYLIPKELGQIFSKINAKVDKQQKK